MFKKANTKFNRKTMTQDGNNMIQVWGEKSIKIKYLDEHREEIVEIESIRKNGQIIQGVELLSEQELRILIKQKQIQNANKKGLLGI